MAIEKINIVKASGESQYRLWAGIACTISKILNNRFDYRNSILNLEHGCIK